MDFDSYLRNYKYAVALIEIDMFFQAFINRAIQQFSDKAVVQQHGTIKSKTQIGATFHTKIVLVPLNVPSIKNKNHYKKVKVSIVNKLTAKRGKRLYKIIQMPKIKVKRVF